MIPVTIQLPTKLVEKLRKTKPPNVDLSTYCLDLIQEGLKKQGFSTKFAKFLKK